MTLHSARAEKSPSAYSHNVPVAKNKFIWFTVWCVCHASCKWASGTVKQLFFQGFNQRILADSLVTRVHSVRFVPICGITLPVAAYLDDASTVTAMGGTICSEGRQNSSHCGKLSSLLNQRSVQLSGGRYSILDLVADRCTPGRNQDQKASEAVLWVGRLLQEFCANLCVSNKPDKYYPENCFVSGMVDKAVKGGVREYNRPNFCPAVWCTE